MTTLTIKDLAIAEDLDQATMSAVRGGYQKMSSYDYCAPKIEMSGYQPKTYTPGNVSLDVSQMIGQSQCVENNNGNNVAFANCINSTVNPTQTANNSIRF